MDISIDDNILQMRWRLLHGPRHSLFYIWIEMGWILDRVYVVTVIVMKPAQEKIENIDQRLRIQPLRGGNLLYIT